MSVTVLTLIPGTPRSSFGHAVAVDELFIIGGHPGPFHQYDRSSFSSEVHAYDIKRNKWRQCRSLPRPIQGLRAATYNKCVYTFGGFSYEPSLPADPWAALSLDKVFRYSVDRDEWDYVADMPHRRSSYICEVLRGRVYLIGGWDGTPRSIGDKRGSFVSSIDVFDFATERFMPSTLSMAVPLRRAFSSTIYEGNIVMVGGLGADGYVNSHLFADALSASVHESNPTPLGSGTLKIEWSLLGQLPHAVFSPGAGVASAQLLVAGGLGPLLPPYGGASLSSIQSYDKNTRSWTTLPVAMSEASRSVRRPARESRGTLCPAAGRG